MVKQQSADRCFSGNSVSWTRIPVAPVYRRHLVTRQVNGSTTTEEKRGEPGPAGGPGETKRARLDRTEEAAALTNRAKVSGSCDQPGSQRSSTADAPDQTIEEPGEDRRSAEAVRSLKVTIQQSSESREFVQTDRTAERQTAGLHCHVCQLTCRSLQLFQEHMMGSEHLRKLKEMTRSICLKTLTLHHRGRRPGAKRWCDTCQLQFSDDIIVHRRTKQHKICKQLCRPFCPVCKRHFRTPRKFVEHMKSSEHKEQVGVHRGYWGGVTSHYPGVTGAVVPEPRGYWGGVTSHYPGVTGAVVPEPRGYWGGGTSTPGLLGRRYQNPGVTGEVVPEPRGYWGGGTSTPGLLGRWYQYPGVTGEAVPVPRGYQYHRSEEGLICRTFAPRCTWRRLRKRS
ncbi:cdkn1a interacting zinc finger protein 1b isoform 2-T2 [Spinachia spinachia]